MQDANKNIEEYNSSRKCNVLIAFSSNKRCYTKLYPFFIIKISNKREVKQNTFDNSSDINSNDFMNLYKKCTAES